MALTTIEFSVAGVLLGLYGLLMFALFCAALVRSLKWRRRKRMSAALQPEIQDALVDYLSGSNDLTKVHELVATSRRDVAEGLMGFRGTVGGSARDRLCDLALNLGLVNDWIQEAQARDAVQRRAAFARMAFVAGYEPCRRVLGDMMIRALHESDPEVWLWVARAVIESGSREQVQRVFDLAISESLLIRILLAEALRRHAVPLCEHAVPEVLRSSDSRRVLAVLDMLVAWERAIPIDKLRELLDHRDRDIRVQALKLAPLVPLASENRAAIIRALVDTDPEVSTAAALSAARLKIEEALPALARLLRLAPAELARTAAAALAEMPPRGWQALEELSASDNPVTATAAAGALARARRKAGP